MKTIVFHHDQAEQIRQLTEVAELIGVNMKPHPHLWGGQVGIEIKWKMLDDLVFSCEKGFVEKFNKQNAYAGDTLTLHFEFAPMHIVKMLVDEHLDRCTFESAHEKAEVLRVYGTPVATLEL